MTRYYRRRRNYRKAPRPSDRIVRAGNTGTIPSGSQIQAYVYEATTPMTVTNFRLDTAAEQNPADNPIVYALVYVPEGYNVNNITYPAITDDIYNPTKNVLISGILTTNATEDHKYSRYSRKMATGDRIALIFYNATVATLNCSFELSFTTLI